MLLLQVITELFEEGFYEIIKFIISNMIPYPRKFIINTAYFLSRNLIYEVLGIFRRMLVRVYDK